MAGKRGFTIGAGLIIITTHIMGTSSQQDVPIPYTGRMETPQYCQKLPQSNKGIQLADAENTWEVIKKGQETMMIDTGLDAVISAFVRNPELSSIQYNAKQKAIVMEMIVTENIADDKQQLFQRRADAALQMLQKRRGKMPVKQSIDVHNQGNISILTLCRDADTLTEEEIDLYVRLAGQEFSNMLLRETDASVLQNKMINDIKKRLLQNINPQKDSSNNIFAYRDRGKMFVYDK